MNVTVDWINSLLDRPARDADEMVVALTDVGFPCAEREKLPGGDERLDIEITSNRGDCVSVMGLAREFAAATGRSVRTPEVKAAGGADHNAEAAESVIAVENRELDLCPYYSARVIHGVRVGPSPDWLRKRVESVGLRAVNNIVDVTNFILYEMGQPLHAFDLARLDGKRIIVRRAATGAAPESIIAIDGSTLRLDSPMLIIADGQRPVAIAGVMGGRNSEVSATTTDIVLEAAVFKPASVRATSRRLRLSSDSSYRFERGIHPATVAAAADRAAKLITEVAGGTVLRGSIVKSSPPPPPVTIALRPRRVRLIAGVDIPDAEMVRRLESLGVSVKQVGEAVQAGAVPYQCTVPAPRLDLGREIDLVEEIVRMHGLARLEARSRLTFEVAPIQNVVENRRRVDGILAAAGFHEVVTFSFINEAEARAFTPAGMGLLWVRDDRRRAEPVLRPSLLPSLLRCRKRNEDAGHRSLAVFEHASCFGMDSAGATIEQARLGLLLDAPDAQAGLRRMRAGIDAAVRAVCGHAVAIRVQPASRPWFAPGGASELFIDEKLLGVFGLLSGAVQSIFDLATPTVGAELDLPSWYDREPPIPAFGDVTVRPAIERDLSLVVDDSVPWARVERIILDPRPPHLESLEFVGTYRGKQIGEGRKSLTLRLNFRDSARTLRREEIDPVMASLVLRLGQEVGGTLRT